MGRNYVVAIILAIAIVLTGCEALNKMALPLPPHGKTMETGDQARPPQGYIDMINRAELTELK